MTTIVSPYTTRTAHSADQSVDRSADRPVRRPRRWAVAGLVAGGAALVGNVANGFVNAAYDKQHGGVATVVRDHLAHQRGALLIFHVFTMISVVVLPIFAAGLVRRLRQAVPTDSLLPAIAGLGVALVSVVGLIGTGLDTEFLNGPINKIAPADSTAFFAHWVGTMPWLWAGAGIAGVAVGVAARAYRAVPRWLGYVGIVLGGLTVVFAVSPLQYMSNMTGLVWLLVTAAGFAVGDKAKA